MSASNFFPLVAHVRKAQYRFCLFELPFSGGPVALACAPKPKKEQIMNDINQLRVLTGVRPTGDNETECAVHLGNCLWRD